MEDPCYNRFILEKGPHAGAENSLRKHRVTEMNCYKLTVMPIPHPPCSAWGGGSNRVGKERMKISLGKKGVGGRYSYNVVLVFLFPNLF